MENKFEMVRRIRLELSGVKINKMAEDETDAQGNCWEGYEQIGMKEKDGVMVPNCVPIKEEQSKVVKEGFPVPSPEGKEDEQTFISRCISEIIDEYGQEQSTAICYSQWENK